MKRSNAGTVFVVVAIVSALCAGCSTTSQGSKTYTTEQAQRGLSVYTGTVLKVSDVRIQANQSGLGTVAGAVLGGVVGSTVGGGSGKVVAATAGAVGGGMAGSAAEKAMKNKAALEIEVELDNGKILAIVQEKDAQFAVGDRVRIIEAPDGTMRVRQ